jgi:hypothetical protein
MKRTYISPEFIYTPVFGTLNMIEEQSFFGSKMINIEDDIVIDNRVITYYENINNEQINFSAESLLSPIVFTMNDEKLNNQTLVIDTKQALSDKETDTNWILTVNIQTILEDYIFANIKTNRTFEGVLNNMTLKNSTDVAIRDYITNNILNRYTFNNIDLFIKYNDLKTVSGALRYATTWNINIGQETYLLKKVLTNVDINQTTLTATFKQEQPSNLYNFDYYFNIGFMRK